MWIHQPWPEQSEGHLLTCSTWQPSPVKPVKQVHRLEGAQLPWPDQLYGQLPSANIGASMENINASAGSPISAPAGSTIEMPVAAGAISIAIIFSYPLFSVFPTDHIRVGPTWKPRSQ